MRERAAHALGQLGDARAVEALIAASKDDADGWVRTRAQEALKQLGYDGKGEDG